MKRGDDELLTTKYLQGGVEQTFSPVTGPGIGVKKAIASAIAVALGVFILALGIIGLLH